MPSAAADTSPIVAWKGDTYRLIPSRFPPVSVYQGLTANDRTDALAEIEALTNPRLRSQTRLAAGGEDAGTSHRLQNWNLAPFAYGDPDGSTFFDEQRPCLEVAADRQTALAISVMRRHRFLERTAEAAIGLDMRMFKTPVSGRFLDLRARPAEETHAAARRIGESLAAGVDGILYRPADRPTAVALAIVNGSTLGRTLQTSHYRYMWNGERFTLLYTFDEAQTEIDPALLRGEADCLAAA